MTLVAAWRNLIGTARMRLSATLPRSLRRADPPYRPQFDSDAPARRFAQWLEGRGAAFPPGFERDPRMHVVRHFRERDCPAALVSPRALRERAELVSRRHPEWKEDLLRVTARDRCEGLPIYATLGAPLRAGFPWAGESGAPGSDVQYAKRPHRFGFLPRLALAALFDAGRRHWLLETVEDWQAFAAGTRNNLAYHSNLAVVQRLTACTWALSVLQALESDGGHEAEWRLLEVIAADIEFLVPRLGTSVNNNHLLADLAAGWLIASLFPEFAPAMLDASLHEARFLEELARQTYPDGGCFEHSLHYQEFACELAVIHRLVCERQRRAVATESDRLLQAMLAFQGDLAAETQPLLNLGDGTEEGFLPLVGDRSLGPQAWRVVHDVWFPPRRWHCPVPPQARFGALWLVGERALQPLGDGTVGAPVAFCHPQSGVYGMPDSALEGTVVLRSGPAPDTDVYGGHLHADLLSVVARVGAETLLCDPGTYSYRAASRAWPPGEPAWRDHFRGPAAHNGLYIEGHDPLGPVFGDFRPRRIASRVRVTRCVDAARLRWVEGVVDGEGPYVAHRRGLVHVVGAYWIVYDVVLGSHPRASLRFQFSDRSEVSVRDDGLVTARAGTAQLFLRPCGELPAPSVVEGQRNPPGGWISPAYGALLPAPQVVWPMPDAMQAAAVLLVAGTSSRIPVELEVHHDAPSGAVCLRVGFDDATDRLLLPGVGDSAHDAVGLEFEGEMAWVRSGPEGVRGVRWTNGRRLRSAALGLDLDCEDTVPALVREPFEGGASGAAP